MGAFVGLAGKALKAVLKIALFCGLAWFLIPFGVWLATELITGKYLEQVPVMNTVCNILWYMCYGFAPLTLILEMPKGICYNANRQERRKCSLWHAKSPGVATSGACLCAPSGRMFQRVKVPNPPDSGKDIAKSKGVPGNWESEGSWRQITGLTNRNHEG